MCDKFFDSVNLPEDDLFAGGLNVVHQVGGKVEGGFLLHFMMTQFFRKYTDNARVLLVLNHHSKAHWTAIGSKLGTNVSALQEKGTLVVIDLLKECLSELQSNSAVSPSKNLSELYCRCERAVEGFKKSGPTSRILVIIEDLTDFLDTGCLQTSERNAAQVLLKLRALSSESVTPLTVATLVHSPDVGSESLERARFARTVSQALPTVAFEVAPLSTGFSVNVTGFLKVTCKSHKGTVSGSKRTERGFMKNFHFKLDTNSARTTPL